MNLRYQGGIKIGNLREFRIGNLEEFKIKSLKAAWANIQLDSLHLRIALIFLRLSGLFREIEHLSCQISFFVCYWFELEREKLEFLQYFIV